MEILGLTNYWEKKLRKSVCYTLQLQPTFNLKLDFDGRVFSEWSQIYNNKCVEAVEMNDSKIFNLIIS